MAVAQYGSVNPTVLAFSRFLVADLAMLVFCLTFIVCLEDSVFVAILDSCAMAFVMPQKINVAMTAKMESFFMCLLL